MSLKLIAEQSKASQDGWEMWQVLKAVEEIKPKVIVEIGYDGGGCLLTYAKAFPEARIIGIDLNGVEVKHRNITTLKYDSTIPLNIKKLTDVLGNSLIDFLFIDGDHRYGPAKKDFENYKDLVRTGGIIGFHDTNNRGISGVEVDLLMKEISNTMSYNTADFRADRMSPGTALIWV